MVQSLGRGLVGLLLITIIGCSGEEDELMNMESTDDLNILADNFKVYVSDAGNFDNPPWRILQFDHQGENATIFTEEELDWPQDILFLEERGEVLISNLNSGQINRHDATTGEYLGVFADDIAGPTRMKIGPDGLLYVLQWSGNGLALRFNLDGDFLDAFTDRGVSQSIGIDWDSENNLYISSFDQKTVTKFDQEGKNQGVFIRSNLQGPTNIWFDGNNNLLVNDWQSGLIVKFDGSGEFIENIATGLREVEGVAILESGGILVGAGATSTVKYIDETGSLIGDFIERRSGGLIRPNAIVIRQDSP